MNHYPRLDQIRAATEKQMALESRDIAKRYLRMGLRRAHRDFMHDAVRAWRNFRYYAARAAR